MSWGVSSQFVRGGVVTGFSRWGWNLPKKLQDFMVDAKIPRAWRDNVPLVCSPQHILWVVGWRLDHRARVTPSTKRVLCLEFESVKKLDKSFRLVV